MAANETEPGKPDIDGSTFRVMNRANAPREFKIAGKWFRWEPSGMSGDSLNLASDIVKSSDFENVRKYFAVKENANA